MKKIGFIDYYLNEWHADNYPAWLKELSGGEYEVKYAYAQIDCPFDGSLTNAQWCEKYGVEFIPDINELIEKSDCLIVLSPDNCEKHLELALPAVSSGKPVFIDKTFCNGKDEAEKIFAAAEKNGSPCFSTSAMRFSPKLNEIDTSDINTVIGFGHFEPENYIIHQLEPIAVLMGTDVEKVIFTGNEKCPSWQLVFSSGKTAGINMPQGEWSHYFIVNHDKKNETVVLNDDIWKGAMLAILDLFENGKEAVPHNVTTKIMNIREKCFEAMKNAGEWVYIK